MKRGADIHSDLTDIVPATAVWNDKAMDFWKERGIGFAVDILCFLRFLIPYVRDALEEEKREDVALPICASDSLTT